MTYACVVGFVLCFPFFLHENAVHPGGAETRRAKPDPTHSLQPSAGKPRPPESHSIADVEQVSAGGPGWLKS